MATTAAEYLALSPEARAIVRASAAKMPQLTPSRAMSILTLLGVAK